MTKEKISATLSPDRLARARQITGKTNVSELLDDALAALIEREQELRWLAAHDEADLPGEVPPDLSGIPWEPK
jgi:post-segregation antitoxin (ccd killing protein)